jgi:tetratricopeptide (TPR) repeat protein
MATVFLATDVRYDRKVAIKVLSPELAASVGSERFVREIEIAAKLQHPHILPVYDSGEADGLLYYVMPFVEGESLGDLVARDGALRTADAIQITRDVAGALDYAHRQGIVHRDIKPANILISDGNAVVADFGIARAISVSGGAALTQTGIAIGTPSYMSPEQAFGGENVDGRTDVYALGCVLFEMLNGRPAFSGNTPQSIIAQSISGDIPKLENDSMGMQPVVERAMAKEPDDRYQTAGELRAALSLGGTGTVTVVSRRRARTAAAVIVGVMAVIAAAALWPRGWSVEGDPRHSLIIFPFENKTGDVGNDYLQEASMNLLGLAVSNWEDLRLYDDERTSSLMRRRDLDSPADVDFQVAQEIAKDARVGTLVLGDIRRERDSIAVEAKVHDVGTGDRISTEVLRASYDADPRPLFDSLAARILQVSGAPAGVNPALVAQTTHSLEAYRAYLRGVESLQRFEIDSARAQLQRAVELDSTFALAYLRLRDVDGWAGLESNPERRREWVAKAHAHSAALPPRLRTLLQFHVAYENGEFREARRHVEDLIARDSADAEAWYQLGEAHFHHNSQGVLEGPDIHPDTLGNIGKALYAFRRTLEIEPRYMMAYQHVLDCLGACARGTRWLCFEDSAVYASRSELASRYGAERVEEMRREAGEASVVAGHDWVDAVPQSGRARSALINLLYGQERFGEMRAQLGALRVTGDVLGSRIWETRLLLREARYREAADTAVESMSDVRVLESLMADGDGVFAALAILAGGGRRDAMERLLDDLVSAIAELMDEVNTFGIPTPVELLTPGLTLLLAGDIYTEADPLGVMGLAWLNSVDSLWGDDPTLLRTGVQGSQVLLTNAYLATRDSILLSSVLQLSDTTDSRMWLVMDAHLGLDRCDTARVEADLDRAVPDPSSMAFGGTQGAILRFAWADLYARLGRTETALGIYEGFDVDEGRLFHPGLHVRSYAERGALYQQLGNTDRAIEMYQLFVDAWRNASPSLQPLVEQARSTIAALGGAVAPPRR